MKIAYLSLGSNLGDRLELLAEAVRRLEGERTRVTAVSSVYETLPQGKTDQPLFLNIAVAVATELSPLALLHQVQEVERTLGRERKERWGPRTVDIDILLYGEEQMQTEALEVPHPRMDERAFVLVPLLELNSDLALPTGSENGTISLKRLLEGLPDQGVIRLLESDGFIKRIKGVQ